MKKIIVKIESCTFLIATLAIIAGDALNIAFKIKVSSWTSIIIFKKKGRERKR
jgi:hypothetical protein